jgi:hypothetical protein
MILYQQSTNKTGSISSHYTQDRWDISTHDPLIHLQAREEKEQLQLALAEIKPNMNKDIPVWTRNGSGMFTSISAYKFITKGLQIETYILKNVVFVSGNGQLHMHFFISINKKKFRP